MTDLSTKYLGLDLKNPLVASASPLSEKIETVRELEAAGVSAVVVYSLFEEQIVKESLELDYFLSRDTESFAEALTQLPDIGKYSLGPEKYIEHIANLKKAVDIPIIGSLNGVSSGGWVDYAKKIQEAGADALELNLYYLPTDTAIAGNELEAAYLSTVNTVSSKISIPLAVKLSPFVTAIPNFAQKLAQAGANGLVLFNRFYQPDFDLEELEVVPNLVLSASDELLLPLRWIAILQGRVPVDFALTSGVHTAEDMLKAMMAGAKVAMSASALLKNGVKHASQLLADLEAWMVEHEYESIQQMQGSLSQESSGNDAAFERANYMKVLGSY
ncbi:MAG: dihydroorotate dehydrogenase-like protein [Anaerolineales bacterium]|nr:dihydroorotate dehydrogenase-like protein [Chloroflexota bacterium]MBL6981445.1 dihydroorotate dehydrogenase-like protein [Anaerolineales bacterium]